MAYFLLGIAGLGLLILAAVAFVQAPPAVLAQVMRQGLGYSALILAAIFAFTGRAAFALPLAWLGFVLLRRRFHYPGGFTGTGKPSAGQTSRVRTATLEMTLDHDTGEMDGEILAGPSTGARLSDLDLDALIDLRRKAATKDPKAVQLIDAFLDRMHEGWRDHPGADDVDSERGGGESTGPMTRQEACEILGVTPDASKDDIRRAHRQLMKKLHPDQGGSTYLASKVNEAKDLLLGT